MKRVATGLFFLVCFIFLNTSDVHALSCGYNEYTYVYCEDGVCNDSFSITPVPTGEMCGTYLTFNESTFPLEVLVGLQEMDEAIYGDGVFQNGIYETRTGRNYFTRANQYCSSTENEQIANNCDEYLKLILSGTKTMSSNSYDEFLVLKKEKVALVKGSVRSHKMERIIMYSVIFLIALIPTFLALLPHAKNSFWNRRYVMVHMFTAVIFLVLSINFSLGWYEATAGILSQAAIFVLGMLVLIAVIKRINNSCQ